MANARYTVCLAFAVCLGWVHGKPDLCRVLLTANRRAHGKCRLSVSARHTHSIMFVLVFQKYFLNI